MASRLQPVVLQEVTEFTLATRDVDNMVLRVDSFAER